MAVYYETLRHNILHDGEHLIKHCNIDATKHVAIRSVDLVCQMIASEHWTVCRWCIGPAVTVDEGIGLVLGLIKREDLQDA